MNLVDSSGWLEYFTDGKNAKFFAPIIEDTKKLMVSTINLYEIFKKILKEKDENSALQAIGLMQQAKVVEVNTSIAISAAKISFDKNIPMADSLIYTTARLFNATVWTQDFDFKDLDGVKFIKKK